jgi:NADPH:quinone reductase-like Zn-dependent oxidoreductase
VRAIRVHESGGIDTMRLDEIPRPVPEAGEVLVVVKAAGVGPWDRLVHEGQSGLGQALPLTLGSDISGTVAALGVGACATQMAKEAGASVYGTARTRDIERVRALGAEPIVEGDRVGAQLASRPLDAVIDTIGGDALESTCDALRPNGIIVSIVRPPDEAYVRSRGVRAAYFIVDVTRDRLDRISTMVQRGTLNLPVGEVLDLADASTAHRMLDGAPHKPGKIVLRVAD